MRCLLFACVLFATGYSSRAQLNYEGNPLTETIDYTAQESKSSRLNAQRDYKSFEVAYDRATDLSKHSPTYPVSSSSTDPPSIDKTKNSSFADVVKTNYDGRARKSTLLDKESSFIEYPQRHGTHQVSASSSTPMAISQSPIDDLPKDLSTNLDIEVFHTDARQMRDFPIRSVVPETHQAILSEKVAESYPRDAQAYAPIESATIGRSSTENSLPQPGYRISGVSDEALKRFLNSRTPGESEMALQTYLATRSREELAGRNVYQEGILRNTLDNEIPRNNDFSQQVDDTGKLPIEASSADPTSRLSYSPRSPGHHSQQPYFGSSWSPVSAQSRRDGFHSFPSMTRRRPVYRGPMRSRPSPWAQSRIAPGPPIYRPKGPLYGGPPIMPGNWKQPPELIYTKPPGSIVNGEAIIGNRPIAYEDAGKYFAESDHPPPPSTKDVYYSQLYAQSYDPHYYNYIAKTGKIKPWLYGKLGKPEEKSIWWELFTGFKNHGMKNMMNPMFLLGMSIPTLTLMLSALVQKRSAARANTDDYYSRDFVDKYEPQIRAALTDDDERMKNGTYLDPSQNRRLQKRSTGRGVYRLEKYFSTHQDQIAAAISAHDQQIEARLGRDEKEKKSTRRRTSEKSGSRLLDPSRIANSTNFKRLGEKINRDKIPPEKIKLD